MLPLRTVPDAEVDPLADLRGRITEYLRLGHAGAILDELERLPLPTLLEQVELSAALGFAGGLAGEPSLARALLNELEATPRSTTIPADARAALAHLDLSLCGWEGRLDDIVGPVDVLISELRRSADHERGFILDGTSASAALSGGLLVLGRFDEAVDVAERALVLDELVPVSRQAVQASGIKALALAWSGSPDAREAAREARTILGRYHGVGATPLFVHAATCWAGTLDEATAAIEPMRGAAAALPVPTFNALCLLANTKALIRCADIRGATETMQRAHEELHALPQPGYLASVATQLDDELSAADCARADTLTAVEIHTLELLARGATRSEIASELNYSVNTIKTYLRRTYRKLGASSRDEAITIARRHGLLDQADRER